MEEFLSIGDVSRLSGVGIKALRYYEKIGIFKPAYINPETNYRYYLHDQILLLDMIQLCLEVGIPLSTAAQYILPDGTVMARDLFVMGLDLAQEKVNRLNRKIQHMQYALEQMNTQEQFSTLPPQQVYIRHFPARKIFAVNRHELGLHLPRSTSWEKINVMAKDAQVEITYPCGSVISYSNGELTEHMFMEAHVADTDCYYVRSIPEGNFRCIRTENESWSDVDLLIGKPTPAHFQFVINGVMEPTTNSKRPVYEIQFPLRSDHRVWVDSH